MLKARSLVQPPHPAIHSRHRTIRIRPSAQYKILVESNPPPEKLAKLGTASWPTWSCPPSDFPWEYDSTETALILEGSAIITPNGGEPISIKKGDFVVFPSGMACRWKVVSAIKKHYNFS